MDIDEEPGPFLVLVNDEEQYSLWQKRIRVPDGWRTVGPEGSKQECLAFIEATWTDMRPRSLRIEMDGQPAHVPTPDRTQ